METTLLDRRTKTRAMVRRASFHALIYIIVSVYTVFLIFPVVWLFLLSIKKPLDLMKMPPVWISIPPVIESYYNAFTIRPLWAYIANSIITTFTSTSFAVLLGSMAGYGFARFVTTKIKNPMMLVILATRMIPPVTLALPLFIIMKNMNLLDRRLALIIAYSTFSLPFSIWLMHSFFLNFPKELEEAAIIDGCSYYGVFARIVIPVSSPGLVSTAVLAMLLAWKDFLWAMLFTYSPRSQTIPVGLSTYMTMVYQRWGEITAVGVLGVFPILIFSFFVQNYIIRGLTAGAIKG